MKGISKYHLEANSVRYELRCIHACGRFIIKASCFSEKKKWKKIQFEHVFFSGDLIRHEIHVLSIYTPSISRFWRIPNAHAQKYVPPPNYKTLVLVEFCSSHEAKEAAEKVNKDDLKVNDEVTLTVQLMSEYETWYTNDFGKQKVMRSMQFFVFHLQCKELLIIEALIEFIISNINFSLNIQMFSYPT